jgi:hypothetical protein
MTSVQGQLGAKCLMTLACAFVGYLTMFAVSRPVVLNEGNMAPQVAMPYFWEATGKSRKIGGHGNC